MSLSKANLDLSKPLSAEERHLLMTLQQRACNSQEILTESEGLEEWGLASEGQGCAMSDASKRRMTEFVGHADHPPAGYTSLAPSPPLHPFISTVEGDPVQLGTTKKGTMIAFPPGVADLSTWGSTILEFGKFGGIEFTYEDLMRSGEKEHKSYVKWCVSQADSSEGRLRDLCLYLVAYENVTGTMEQRPVIPGTTEVRRLRRQ